ncbi:MAG: LysM peptidoglycan-binding domain-containing protein [Flavobacterium sp.]|nr:LysM peptidoglycan-binding domain-containing protein [Flavobacterium sp.]
MKYLIITFMLFLSCNLGFSQDKKPKLTIKNHTVLEKETVYGVAKLYGITVQDLVIFNPSVAELGFKPGQILKIPNKGAAKPIDFKIANPEKPIDKTKTVLHEVLPKETKYAIAKKYNITIQELEKLNPEIVGGLQIGSKLYISGKRPKIVVPKVITKIDSVKISKEIKKEIVNVKDLSKSKPAEYADYKIKSKETLYSLSKMFSISQENLISINPELANGVQESMTIKVPIATSIKTETKKEKSDLLKYSKNTTKKQLAILLPFNISKMEGDTINNQEKRLKKDGFLNMTLDFYAGALIAIDSAKTLGLNISIKFLDSQETKTSSNVENLIIDNNLKKYDALIGPFYKIHSDKAAQMLEENNVPVISPLSKDAGKSFKNLYASMPSSEFIKDEMFDFMNQNKGNIIAIIDPKKTAIKQYINDNQKGTKIINIDINGSLDTDNLKNSIFKDKINYVILASEKTGMILSVTNALLNLYKENDIRLVILENNETLDFEEIPLARLTKLKMTYPSLSRDNNSENAKIFENSFKRKNKIFPNQYATRGFDITFDTMTRLSQDKTFEQTINELASEQVESKFDYFKKVSGGYVNRGVFILQYNQDLTISEAE